MFLAGLAVPSPQAIELKKHMVISKSAIVAPKLYGLPSNFDIAKPVIAIRGDNITVDFKGSILAGSLMATEPNERKGLAVVIQGKNVTIKNLKVRGYQLGVYAKNSPGLKVIDCDFSYNYKPWLASTLEKEDLSDWMSYHHNDKDEWLLGDEEYRKTKGQGGNPPKWPALYLDGCDNFEIKNLKAVGGQNAVMLNRSNKGLLWNSDLSFNSGVGLAMYRSSGNRIMHNSIDWCVRGFSLGKYNRGQDSAGILIYEQSNKNIFAYNSVTHGGDGFFLWAGQHTMDTGEGGCNDNLLFGNDFSHAPTNGIEATFSRNNFVNNLVLECWHGIWGGYGFDSKVIGNVFGYNAEAIAWEHGQNNIVEHNLFVADNEGIYLWSNPSQDPNWGYAKKRDTRSRDWRISKNTFADVFTNVLHLRRSQDIQFTGNELTRFGAPLKNDGDVSGLTFESNKTLVGKPRGPMSSLNLGQIDSVEKYLARFDVPWSPVGFAGGSGPVDRMREVMGRSDAVRSFTPMPLKGGRMPFLKRGALRGWRYMMVDHWGPYDFKSPLLWPREELHAMSSAGIDENGKQIQVGSKTQRFEILGPRGKWKVVSLKGASLNAKSGVVPGTIEVTTPLYTTGTIDIQLEYTGEATTDYRGNVTPAGKPVRFGYNVFVAPIDWNIKLFKWSKAANPSDAHSVPDETAYQAVIKGAPVKELRQNKLDFAGYAFDPATGNDHYATVAEGTFELPAGDYVLEMTTDDGARLWLDGKPLIEDAWHYQGPTLYSRDIKLAAGKHTLRVEHFQIDGYAALKVGLRPKGR